jgi:hypothetical protein
MSIMSDILASGLAALAEIEGHNLDYRTTENGSWVALSGFCISEQRVAEPQYDADDHVTEQKRLATLKGPVSPTIVKGYEIRDNTTGRTWAVESVSFSAQQVVILWRTEVGAHGADRGDQA